MRTRLLTTLPHPRARGLRRIARDAVSADFASATQVLRVLSGGALAPNALPTARSWLQQNGVLRQNDVNTRFLNANLKLYSNLARCTVLSEDKF